MGHEGQWNVTQRIRLVEAANLKEGEIHVLPNSGDRNAVGLPEQLERAWLNEDWLDIKFTGVGGIPVGCAEKELCKALEEKFQFLSRWEGQYEETEWKYLIDVSRMGHTSH